MPQFDQALATLASQAFWLLVTFGLLYFGIAKTMLPKVGKVIEDRERKISGDLNAAETARAAGAAARDEHDRILLDARTRAASRIEASRQQIAADQSDALAAAAGRLEARIKGADEAVKAAGEQISAEIDRIAAEAAEQIVSRLTDRRPTADELSAARAVAG